MKNKKKDKIVYIAMSADILHPGHLNIINCGVKLGKVVIGLLTDEAIASYKRVPTMEYSARFEVISSLKGVSYVIPQKKLDYYDNLIKLKPDYVVHGDDWKKGVQQKVRAKVIKTLRKWGGKLIEPKYTPGVSSTLINKKINSKGITTDQRKKSLSRILKVKDFLIAMEAFNGLSALIVEKTEVKKKNFSTQFDAIWSSSLTTSTSLGKPDNESVDLTKRLNLVDEIFDVTTKPLIFDGDTGGKTEHFVSNVKTLERMGVSAVIIEDKIGLKKNSLLGNTVCQKQETIKNFCKKISAGINAKTTDDFLIIARIESLILGKGIKDAILRAKEYIKAGADGIMIHSKEKTPKEIFSFCKLYKKLKKRKWLVVVPTSYNTVKLSEFKKRGVNIVIYANHLLRSSYPNMVKTANLILKNGRSKEAENQMLSINEILSLIPGTK